MSNTDVSHSSEGRHPFDDGAENEIFAPPGQTKKVSHHRRQPKREHPRQKRSRDENSKQSRNRSPTKNQRRNQKTNRNEHLAQTTPSKEKPRNIQSAGDIFVVPKEQKTKDSRPGQSQRKNRHHLDRGDKLRGPNEHSQQTTKREQGHESILTATNRPKDDTACILEWDSPLGYVPLSEEESMVEFMFRRNGKRERGMLKGKPSHVVSKYRKAMKQHAPTMNFPQLLSLRRHHIKLFNEHRNMTQLGLGNRDDINKSAKIFEWAIEKFLKKVSIDFLTEEQQREEAAKEEGILQATPDFILPKPTVLRKVHKKKTKKKQYRVLEERTIHWIEAKMFYGASSIPHGSKGAVGTVLARAQKYVDNFGEGAIIFMMGCGDKLAAELNDIGVSVLDCSGNTVSLDSVHDHQRMWCADEKGRILP